MPFTIVTVGCGALATRMHGPARLAYAARRPEARLAACCDLDAAKAATYRAAFGFARCYTDLDRMLDAERPDAVGVVVHESHTAAVCRHVLARGYPVLTEKPPGLTLAETDAMIAAAKAGGTVCGVAFNRRWMPLVRAATERYDAADLQHLRYELTRVRRTDPDFGTTAIHGYDLVSYLAGSPYAEVELRFRELPELVATVHNALLTGAFASGATCQLEICPCAGVGVERATLHLTDSTLALHLPAWGGLDGQGVLRRYVRGELVEELVAEALVPGGEDWISGGFAAETEAFYEAIRAGQPPPCDLHAARPAVALMEAQRDRRLAYRAAPGE